MTNQVVVADDGAFVPTGSLQTTLQWARDLSSFRENCAYRGVEYAQTTIISGGNPQKTSPWQKFYISGSTERINKNRILGLYNSNTSTSSMSQTAFRKYAEAYGFSPDYMLGFDMGTTDGSIPNFVSTILPAVQAYVVENGITAIFCSLGVPILATSNGSLDDTLKYLKLCGSLTKASSNAVGGSSTPPSNSLIWDGQGAIPVGRLGIPLPGSYANESIGAMLSQAQGSLSVAGLNNKSKPFVQGFYSRPPPEVAAYTNTNHQIAWGYAQTAGLSNMSNYVHGTLDAPGLTPTQAAQTLTQTYASIEAGTASPSIPYFVLWDCAFANITTPANSFLPMKGSVAFNWTSSGFYFVATQLALGASCGIGSVSEPFAGNLPSIYSLLDRLFRGYSCCEAVLTCASTQGDAYGDPLCCPYGVLP
jgi:hypothetical protein